LDNKTGKVDQDQEGDILARSLQEFFIQRNKANAVPLPDEQRWQDVTSKTGEAFHQFLSFRLADEMFAVSIMDISEIIKPSIFTEVPRTSVALLGVLSLRGVIVPVLDLRLLLGLDDLEQTRSSRVLIISNHDEKIGLLVDEVHHVIRLSDTDIEPPGSLWSGSESEHIIGVGRLDGQMFTLLDLESMIDPERFIDKFERG